MEKLKRGTRREDGKLLWQYIKKPDGSFYEYWVSPERFEVLFQKTKAEVKEWQSENREKAKAATRKWQAANREKVNAINSKWAANNPEKVKAQVVKYREENREKVNADAKRWAAANPDKLRVNQARIRQKKRLLGIPRTPIQKIKSAARTRLRGMIQGKNRNTCSYIGCSWQELVAHIQSQFTQGMSWENYGLYGWHVDHRIPLASATCLEEMVPLLHFSNLQPLWAKDNLSKGARIISLNRPSTNNQTS